jgi:hypothetical protein
MEEDAYLFHQTPIELAKELIALTPITESDRLYEPFKGEGAFYNHFPDTNPKDWGEITQGRDYKDYEGEYDWVITNPPFRLDTGAKRVNAFWFLLDYYTDRAKKGIAFLANDSCFCTLTPRRMQLLKEKGWNIQSITVCSVKKWRGRYFYIVLERKPEGCMKYLLTNY